MRILSEFLLVLRSALQYFPFFYLYIYRTFFLKKITRRERFLNFWTFMFSALFIAATLVLFSIFYFVILIILVILFDFTLPNFTYDYFLILFFVLGHIQGYRDFLKIRDEGDEKIPRIFPDDAYKED